MKKILTDDRNQKKKKKSKKKKKNEFQQVVKLVPRWQPGLLSTSPTPDMVPFEMLESTVKAFFHTRRKTLGASVRRLTAQAVRPVDLETAGINPDLRPQDLSTEAWQVLARMCAGKMK
jgi:16S rRNA A1518/A1519 N6-dimethyltransferase RsmA/KsgA/DIM1 with predicted DNA glycosylase/AP lyase activity